MKNATIVIECDPTDLTLIKTYPGIASSYRVPNKLLIKYARIVFDEAIRLATVNNFIIMGPKAFTTKVVEKLKAEFPDYDISDENLYYQLIKK